MYTSDPIQRIASILHVKLQLFGEQIAYLGILTEMDVYQKRHSSVTTFCVRVRAYVRVCVCEDFKIFGQ
jgi:hypothetical protein